jgi:hypothetical protein
VIDDEGKRVTEEATPSILRKIALGAPTHKIRYFAFYLSNEPLAKQRVSKSDPDRLDYLFSRGARTLPVLTMNAVRYECVAYVYVIEKSQLTGGLTLVRDPSRLDSRLDAKGHLSAAGIWSTLGFHN